MDEKEAEQKKAQKILDAIRRLGGNPVAFYPNDPDSEARLKRLEEKANSQN